MYDVIIVGAGVAGCSSAYWLHQKGLKVLVLDQASETASGGSGAAGAFVSPKIGKDSPLQQLTNEAFIFAKAFYTKFFPKYFHQTSVIRIPKDQVDNKKFEMYREFNIDNFHDVSADEIKEIGIESQFDGFLFPEAGVCNAKELCQALIEGIAFKSLCVEQIDKEEGKWVVNNTLQSKYIILSTGYNDALLDLRYMGIRGTWGSRGDFKSNLPILKSIHKDLSISKNMEGVIKIGATHNKVKAPCLECQNEPLTTLLQKASKLIDVSQLELDKVYCGMRSGSKDYFPLVGGVVDVEYMLKHYPKLSRGQKVKALKMIDNLFVLNGLGGRGFVFAPLMAYNLAQHIAHDKALDARIDPNRLFLRWARRLKEFG